MWLGRLWCFVAAEGGFYGTRLGPGYVQRSAGAGAVRTAAFAIANTYTAPPAVSRPGAASAKRSGLTSHGLLQRASDKGI